MLHPPIPSERGRGADTGRLPPFQEGLQRRGRPVLQGPDPRFGQDGAP